MARKAKHPNHKQQAQALMNELLDGLVSIWTSEKEPELKAVSAELEMSPAKVRKLLITAGERDHTTGRFLETSIFSLGNPLTIGTILHSMTAA